jgi:molybdate transport system permease protein
MIDWEAIGITTRLSASTSLLLLAIGIPTAYWLAATRWRGRVLVEAVVALPLVLPPTVLGFYVLVLLGPKAIFGRWFEAIVGNPLPFSFTGLVIASVLYSLPFAVQPFAAAFRSLDPTLTEAAAMMGASRWQTLWHVLVPNALPGILAGMVLSFAHTLGEFGVVLMVGGNIAGRTRTISISIYDQVQSMDYNSAAANALLLLAISFLMLSITYLLQRSFRVY